MLIKIKNASLMKYGSLIVPKTSFGVVLIKFLYKNGLIQSYRISSNEILVFFKFLSGNVLTESLKLVSVPSLKKHLSYNDISKINSRTKIYIFSTSKGLSTLTDCKKLKLGGTLLFIC